MVDGLVWLVGLGSGYVLVFVWLDWWWWGVIDFCWYLLCYGLLWWCYWFVWGGDCVIEWGGWVVGLVLLLFCGFLLLFFGWVGLGGGVIFDGVGDWWKLGVGV